MTASKINPSLFSQDKNLNKIKQEDTSMKSVATSEYTAFEEIVVKSDELYNTIPARGDLSDDIKSLQLNQRKVRVNNSGNYIDPSTIDNLEEANILEFSSSSLENNFNRNGKLSEQGKLIYTGIFSKLHFLINELLEKIGIKSSTEDNRIWCRHLAVAFMAGLITLEELDNVKNPQDFEKLLAEIKANNKNIVDKNKTLLELLEEECNKNSIKMGHSMLTSLIPPDYKPEYACLTKIVESLSLLEPQKNFNDENEEIKHQVKIAKATIINIIFSTGTRKKDLINKLKSNIEKIEVEVNQLIANKLTPESISNSAIDMIHQQLQTLKNLREDKNIELTTGLSEGQSIDNLEKIADLLEKNNKKKDAKKIRSLIKEGYFHLISKNNFDFIFNIIKNNYIILLDFFIEQIPDIFSSQIINDKNEAILSSEYKLGDTLYSMCKAVIDSSDDSTSINNKRFFMQTVSHAMMLEIKYKNNTVYINFYNPNYTFIYKQIKLTSVEYVKQLSIKNFLSDEDRIIHKTASKEDIKNNDFSTKNGRIVFARGIKIPPVLAPVV